MLDVSKVEDGKVRFTGIDVERLEDRIELSMNDYAVSLEEQSSKNLTREEMQVLRKYVGKLSWLATNTRPDLAVYALDLAKKGVSVTKGSGDKVTGKAGR